MRVIAAMCALLVVVPRICVSDEFFRCGTWLASADMSVADLLKKCGEPSSRQISTENVYGARGYKVGTTTIEKWRYDRGSRAAPMMVTIVDGQIRSMKRVK